MAAKRSAKYPYRWSNGTWHSRPENTGRGAPKPAMPPLPRPMPRPTNVGRIPTPAPTPLTPRIPPLDPQYEADVGALQRQRDTTLGQLEPQRAQGLIGYGYTESPTGALTFDPNNPFSKAAQLQRNYDMQRRRTGGQLAAGGQLYAGAYQNAQDYVNRGELQGQDELQRSLADFLARNTAARAEARTQYQTGMAQAGAQRLERVPTNPLYQPTVGGTPKMLKPLKKKAAPKRTAPKKATPKKAAPKVVTRKRHGQTQYRWPNGTWHNRRYRGH